MFSCIALQIPVLLTLSSTARLQRPQQVKRLNDPLCQLIYTE